VSWLFGIAVALAVVLGFLVGLFSFKVKTRWCPNCGERLRCVACLHRADALR
jgi:hypothetical protein